MNAATIIMLVVACALVSCAAAAEDAHQSMGKRQSTECIESSKTAADCLQKLGAGTDAAAFCSDCEQVLSKYYEDCNVSGESLEQLCSENGGAATPASVSAISVATATLFALQALL